MNARAACWSFLCAALISPPCFAASSAVQMQLDKTFGSNGQVAVELGVDGNRANAVAVQPDGDILVGGSTSNALDKDFMLFRLHPDGSLDDGFNYNGTVTTALSSGDDEILALALQQDGKVIAGGYSSKGANRDFAMVRYNKDGSIDSAFGSAGTVVTAVGSSNDEITNLAVQADGKIVLTGSAQSTNGRVVVLARYNDNGTPDTTFGNNDGFSLDVVGLDAQAEGLALTDGRILVSGSYSDANKAGMMLLGFNADGKIDTEFGDQGIAVPADGSLFSEGYGMTVGKDGTLLVAGSVGKEGERQAALFRFTAEGQADSSFGANGVLKTADSGSENVLYDVAATDKMIAATGFRTVAESQSREFLLVTSSTAADAAQQASSQASQLAVASTSTAFTDGTDVSTALAAVSETSVVTVGQSAGSSISSAAVSKYTDTAATATGSSSTNSLEAGNQYVVTGEPYEVTRTTAIIQGEVLSGIGGIVSKRGIVFSTMSNPMLNDGSTSGAGVAPVLSDLVPSGTIATTTATLSLTTDVAATCKYDTTAGTAYDQMESSFTAATDGKSHSKQVSNLEGGTSYTYYVRCKNTSSNAVNTTDATISFTVSSTADSGPVRSNLSPSGTIATTSATLSLSTDVAATCKYDTTASTAYDQMDNDFTAATDGKSHTAQVSNLPTGTNTYYVRCKNTATNAVNTTDNTISFTVSASGSNNSAAPVLSNLLPSGTIFTTSATLSLTTDVDATCKYTTSGSGMDYSSMKKFFDITDGKSHSEPVSDLEDGKTYTYYIRCKNTTSGVANTNDSIISFSVSTSHSPVRSSLSPSGTITTTSATLSLNTDVAATCKYDTTAGIAYDQMEDSFTAATGGQSHTAQVSNLENGKEYKYYVRCKNTSSGAVNTADATISFTVSASTSVFPEHSQLVALSDQIIANSLQNVGSFFVGTAFAQDNSTTITGSSDSTNSTSSSTGTTSSSSTSSTSGSTTGSSSSSSTSSGTDSSSEDFLEEGKTEEGSGIGTFTSKLEKLKPGTFFYARAYAVSGGAVYYGNQVGFRTADSCFVATAAFGSVFHPSVKILRDFRDRFLLRSAVGSALVKFYYRNAPPAADFISQHSTLRAAVRFMLLPFVGSAWLLLHSNLLPLLLSAAALPLFAWRGLRLLRTRRNMA